MSCTTVPESQSSLESPECGRSAAEATSQTLKRSSAWIQNIFPSKGVQDYFKKVYGRETNFIPNGVNRPKLRAAEQISEKFGLSKDSYILFLGRLVPEKGIRYLIEAFKQVKTDKKLVIAGGSSDTDSFEESPSELYPDKDV